MKIKERKRATVQEIEEWLKSEGFKELTEEQKKSDEWKETIESCRRIANGEED